MTRPTAAQRPQGFTLIELMVTIAVATILMMVAVPNFITFQRNAELTSTTNTLVAAINAARSEAMKRGAFAMVVPRDGASWNSGWVVFVDQDLSQDFDATKDDVVLEQVAPSDYITVSGNGIAAGSAPYLLYNGSGYAKDKSGGFGATTISIARNDVSEAQAADQTRRIVIAATGRIRSCRPSQDSTCTASAAQ